MNHSIADFLSRLADLDVKVWLKDERLRCTVPRGDLPPGILEELRERKQEIINLLSQPRATGSVPDFDPQAPDCIQNPYPAYKKLREKGAVYKSPSGYWVLTRYKHVREALRNPSLGNTPASYSRIYKKNREKSVCADIANNIIPFMEGVEHADSRRLIIRAFFNQLRRSPPDLRGTAKKLLTLHRHKGEFDLVNDFGRPYATAVICDFLGFPSKDHGQLACWGDLFLYLLTGVPSEDVRNEVEATLTKFRAYCAIWVDKRKANPENDLISALLLSRDGEATLSDSQVIDSCMLLVGDGIENVASLIGSSMATLLQHPDEIERLRKQPDLTKHVVDECLRYESPGQYIARVATEDVSLEGQTICKGESVLLVLASANHDPEIFAYPDNFDTSRNNTQHLSFGRGRHSCVGASLVRLELEVAIKVLLEELPNLQLKEIQLDWRTRPGHRWLERCPVADDGSGQV